MMLSLQGRWYVLGALLAVLASTAAPACVLVHNPVARLSRRLPQKH